MIQKDLIKTAAYYASEAYNDKLSGGIPIKNKWTSMNAFLVRTKELDIFVFRGTQQPLDWLFNISAIPVYSGGTWCHGGFIAGYKSISKRLEALFRPEVPTIITGHSLGGVLAERFAMSCKGDEVHLVTFGKPNLRFRPKKPYLTHLKTQLSIVNGSDVVARVPKILFGPDPGQIILYFPNRGGMVSHAERAFIKRDWEVSDTASDHSMDLYLKKLRKYL